MDEVCQFCIQQCDVLIVRRYLPVELVFFDVQKGTFTSEVIIWDLTVVFSLKLFVHLNWTVAI